MIKAIETVYDGYRFRSRLEARWAVFFNTLQIKYEYEKEGFDIDGVWYLPDFYLPDYNCWIEIKPDSFVFGSDPKINAFAEATKDTFLLISGIPKADNYNHGFSEDERYVIQFLSYENIKAGPAVVEIEKRLKAALPSIQSMVPGLRPVEEDWLKEEIKNYILKYKDPPPRNFFDFFDKKDGWIFGLARKSINPELWIISMSVDASFGLINEPTDDEDSYPTTHGLKEAYEAATQARF